jgi:hypothetical protein
VIFGGSPDALITVAVRSANEINELATLHRLSIPGFKVSLTAIKV